MLQHYIYKKQIKEINRLDSHNTSSANNQQSAMYTLCYQSFSLMQIHLKHQHNTLKQQSVIYLWNLYPNAILTILQPEHFFVSWVTMSTLALRNADDVQRMQ